MKWFSMKLSFIILVITLTGCIATSPEQQAKPNTNHRATFAELTNNNKSVTFQSFSMDRANRAKKLAAIYQEIVSLEPDANVRASVQYRLAQLNTLMLEQSDLTNITDKKLTENDEKLQKLIVQYKQLIAQYPNRKENEEILYQLAKAYDLLGKSSDSLFYIEQLLETYPETKNAAELNFRRGDIYYNRQQYQLALQAYESVLLAPRNEPYVINSLYMSGWALFKQNHLSKANNRFIQLIDTIMANSKINLIPEQFSFTSLSSQYQNILADTQRVLSISVSQQQQAKSLVSLLFHNQNIKFGDYYQHILFDNLAKFLLKKELPIDAKQTYQAYIDNKPQSIWAARFSLQLLSLEHNPKTAKQIEQRFVQNYGVTSEFWENAHSKDKLALLPHLLKFSDKQSRFQYATAQNLPVGEERITAFLNASKALQRYLAHAQLSEAKALLPRPLIEDEYLYAEASFEAQLYQQALAGYQQVVFSTTPNDLFASLKKQASYASNLSIRKLLQQTKDKTSQHYAELIKRRNELDQFYISHYPDDKYALALATEAVQYYEREHNTKAIEKYTQFVLTSYQIKENQPFDKTKFTATQLKQLQIVSQISANHYYQLEQYHFAEKAYLLALQFISPKQTLWKKIRETIASCIYFQAKAAQDKNPQLAITEYLRVRKVIPESATAITAEFDAANLLLATKKWQQAIDVLVQFKQRYPNHHYAQSIPAKLVTAYEATQQWQLAANELMTLVNQSTSSELKREALYTAAEYYQKADNTQKALTTYRTYAHTYEQPFDIAQEVRFKMSEFYVQSKEPNKQFYWYRKILAYHKKALRADNALAKTARESFLASTAAYGLGQAHQQTFNWTKLKAPLKSSLLKKQKAMKRAIGYYQQVLVLNLAGFVTKTTYHLAEMYQQLASDVMHSAKPAGLDELALEEYSMVLEELAYPFEEKAISIHESNIRHAWQNDYDEWVAKSFNALASLSPALYNKQEKIPNVIHAIY